MSCSCYLTHFSLKILIFSFFIFVLSGCVPEKTTYYKINSSKYLELVTSNVGHIKQSYKRSILISKYEVYTKSKLDSTSTLSIRIGDTYYQDIESIYKRTCEKNNLYLNIKGSKFSPIKATVELRNILGYDSVINCLYHFDITLNHLNGFDVILNKNVYGDTPIIKFKKVVKSMVIYAPQS